MTCLLSFLGDPGLQQHVSELSDEPDGTEGERLLRDVGEKSEIESLDSVGLEFGSVTDESDEGGEDLLSDEVPSL